MIFLPSWGRMANNVIVKIVFAERILWNGSRRWWIKEDCQMDEYPGGPPSVCRDPGKYMLWVASIYSNGADSPHSMTISLQFYIFFVLWYFTNTKIAIKQSKITGVDKGGPGGPAPQWPDKKVVKIEGLSNFKWSVFNSSDISNSNSCSNGTESTRSSTTSSSTPWPHSKCPGSHRQICSYWSPSS